MDNNLANSACFMADTDRSKQMQDWLQKLDANIPIYPLAGDASNRRYFRVTLNNQSYVVMDAPPEKEDCIAFLNIANGLRQIGLNTPEIFAQDIKQGFLLLSDFGDRLLFHEINNKNADSLYKKATNALLILQRQSHLPEVSLNHFDHNCYITELQWFSKWYIQQYLELNLTSKQTQLLHQTYEKIIASALAQPQVIIHKDYHSRNLILLDNNELGIIDFQDALIGPITYDLMSLYYDHYIAWPYQKIQQWVHNYYNQLLRLDLIQNITPTEFMRWFDWLALQRILKNLGNFVRLNIMHGKPGYLKDIPRIFKYIQNICQQYPELDTFNSLLNQLKPKETA